MQTAGRAECKVPKKAICQPIVRSARPGPGLASDLLIRTRPDKWAAWTAVHCGSLLRPPADQVDQVYLDGPVWSTHQCRHLSTCQLRRLVSRCRQCFAEKAVGRSQSDEWNDASVCTLPFQTWTTFFSGDINIRKDHVKSIIWFTSDLATFASVAHAQPREVSDSKSPVHSVRPRTWLTSDHRKLSFTKNKS